MQCGRINVSERMSTRGFNIIPRKEVCRQKTHTYESLSSRRPILPLTDEEIAPITPSPSITIDLLFSTIQPGYLKSYSILSSNLNFQQQNSIFNRYLNLNISNLNFFQLGVDTLLIGNSSYSLSESTLTFAQLDITTAAFGRTSYSLDTSDLLFAQIAQNMIKSATLITNTLEFSQINISIIKSYNLSLSNLYFETINNSYLKSFNLNLGNLNFSSITGSYLKLFSLSQDSLNFSSITGSYAKAFSLNLGNLNFSSITGNFIKSLGLSSNTLLFSSVDVSTSLIAGGGFSILHQDTFNRANGNLTGTTFSDGLGQWSDSPGNTWEIQSNRAICTNKANEIGIWDSAMSDVGNQKSEAQIITDDTGVIVRHNGGGAGAENYYMLYFFGGTLTLYRREPGAFTSLASNSDGNTGDTLTLEITGSTINGYVNGSLSVNATDSTLTTGKAGIYGGGTNSSNYDNFKVYT